MQMNKKVNFLKVWMFYYNISHINVNVYNWLKFLGCSGISCKTIKILRFSASSGIIKLYFSHIYITLVMLLCEKFCAHFWETNFVSCQ